MKALQTATTKVAKYTTHVRVCVCECAYVHTCTYICMYVLNSWLHAPVNNKV